MNCIKNYTLFSKYRYLDHLYIYRSLSGLNLWDQDISSEIKYKIEKHWKDQLKYATFEENCNSKPKFYVLPMFPYPSGSLHMGHVRVYTISDTVAHFQRMNGKNVLHPIGWDAFGLPAENAARERKIPPDIWTKQNIAHMKSQIEDLGCSFDWDREFKTCDPDYYQWTQELFLKLFENGLAYQKESLVNWDPVDQTVLADEQVDENGYSWRSGAKVEKKMLKQWFVRTTKFAKSLLEGLDDPILQDWRDITKLQRHWIGDCNGVSFNFRIKDQGSNFMTFWTDFPEHIEHVKFIAVSKDNVLSKKENIGNVEGTVKLKTSVINPFNMEEIPIFVTKEIEFLDQTDSYLGIPGISEEAAVFALANNITYGNLKCIDESKIDQTRLEICEKAKKLNIGGYWTSAKLRDWLISRQRYWGAPIPIIHCQTCGSQPVPREDLPVVLPKLKENSEYISFQLSDISDWKNTKCPKCGNAATRETDTMDTFVDSSWYFLRFPDDKNKNEMFDKHKIGKILPVDLYIGGKEHAVLHMYYARFIMHFLHSLGLVPEREPFKRLLVQGMVMGKCYRTKGIGKYLQEAEVEIIDNKKNKGVTKDTGEPVVITWEKMSKSKHNGVDPKDMFREFGTDTTRLLILADVAPTSHRNWNRNTFPGILTWQHRLWLTIRDFLKHRKNLPSMLPANEFQKHHNYMLDSRNFYVVGASKNYLITQQISVAISKQQGLTNSLRKVPPCIIAHSKHYERALAAQIIMLAPIAPHFASELWSGFTSAENRLNDSSEILWEKTVLEQKWPESDMDYKLELICQVNGTEHVAVKIQRTELERLSKEEAANIALGRTEIQAGINKRDVINCNFILRKGFEGIINILTARGVKSKTKEHSG